MPTQICNIRVRRKTPRFVGFGLDVGHEWIEFLDSSGAVTGSAGFYPSGNIWGSAGTVQSPDSYQGSVAGVVTVNVDRTPPGLGTAFECDTKTCADILECVHSKVAEAKADPPNYTLPFFNCRNFVTWVLTRCCILK
jgi:hypothetical protein